MLCLAVVSVSITRRRSGSSSRQKRIPSRRSTGTPLRGARDPIAVRHKGIRIAGVKGQFRAQFQNTKAPGTVLRNTELLERSYERGTET